MQVTCQINEVKQHQNNNNNLKQTSTSSVNINLYSKWRYTPLYLEASELLAQENNEYFWNYIKIVHDKYNTSNPIQSYNYYQQYKDVVDIVDEILEEPYQLPLLKFALALRSSSPFIAAHEQIALDRLGKNFGKCDAYIEFPQPPSDDSLNDIASNSTNPYNITRHYSDINIYCNADDAAIVFEKIISTEDFNEKYYQPTIYKNDHIYYAHNNPKAKKFGLITSVIYGEIGSEAFIKLYDFAKKIADLGKMNFVVRHLPLSHRSNENSPKVSLGGYGLELAIKSTEYKAQDDTRVKGEESKLVIDGEMERPDEVEDLVFSELIRNNQSDLFHDHILESIKQIPNLNESALADLSAQAVSLVLSVPVEQRLALMQDLNQNFPIVAKSLSELQVNKKLRLELEKNQILFARHFALAPQDTAVFMNGIYLDVDAMDIFAFTEVIKNKIKELYESGGDDERESDIERFLNQHYSDVHSEFIIPPAHPKEPHLKMQVIMDPLTRGAQKIVPILITLSKVINLRIRILFNCDDSHSEMPLKNFYRFVLESEPNFRDGPNNVPSLKAHFRNMPPSSLLTLNMATPENWLVESVKTPFDLDNIHLAEIQGNSVWADFELEHLLLEGHCFDMSTSNPPRGLQFVLGTKNNPAYYDTIVMANLGYFQLKASPGAWSLRLRHGRSAEIYTISHVDGAEFILHQDKKLKSDISTPALLTDFRSRFMKVRVSKKREKRHMDLLHDDNDESSHQASNDIWGSIRNSVWSEPNQPNIDHEQLKASNLEARTTETNRINIFSLASGHLYERLARIMMLSVLKNTKTPVKFWFLKNYLSPTFKDFLPYYAQKYNFDYELVQYKWPRWLHQQSEKQRIIWGYKILFLDVLFPLDVKKIIFVDADQVVRADLKELRDLSLDGAPYGYTPFCDSRTDMDGFRFWKTGYWNSHLHGRKYHISALYVVDLQKFRKIAAGDRLRGQYQGLSQDPNSLSNLDQDLPNNMIHQVAIKSLPQEWLWCETWCDDQSKVKAKTIDLCNNPKTKEPKLTSARRIIKEWQDYDNEIKAVYAQFLGEQQLDSVVGNETEAIIDSFEDLKETVNDAIDHPHTEL